MGLGELTQEANQLESQTVCGDFSFWVYANGMGVRQWARRVIFGVALASAGEKVLRARIVVHPDRTVDFVHEP